MNKNDVEKKITELLNSFLQQSRYGIPVLEAFENSIYNPSKKENSKKEKEILKQTKKINSKKYSLLLRYKTTILDLKKANNGSRKIAKFLNSYKLINVKVSHVFVNDFIKAEEENNER